MAEEFQESDVVFSDQHHQHRHEGHQQETVEPPQCSSMGRGEATKSGCRSSEKQVANSLPVSIPEGIFRCRDSDDDELLEEEWDDEEMVPPHVIIGRRIAGKMAFSVCTGNGRTLKGRDLSQVRNSILRLTGFLEA